jgi:phage terminase large subunit-like protein
VGPDIDAREVGRLLLEAARRCAGDLRVWDHFVGQLPEPVRRGLAQSWQWQAHGGQIEPEGEWAVWLLMAGRGFGKTRAGCEWVHRQARECPHARIALVGGSREDVVNVMIEGPSGLMQVARCDEPVEWVPTRGVVKFASGASAFVYSAAAAEALRGPEHDFAWADELAKWGGEAAGAGLGGSQGDRAWDNLMMGLRLGTRPRVVVTTTPRPTPLLRRVIAAAGAAVTRGTTHDNPHLPAAFVEWVEGAYGGTRLGRQELGGELIEDVEGALFSRSVLEAARVQALSLPLPQGGEGLARIVVGVDPPASTGGTCGIVVCARDSGGLLYVLGDASVGGASPERWARAVAGAAEAWGADRVVAEKNQGGDMVASVLRNANVALPVKLVSASRGKSARAEPVAALFEAGRAKLGGRFPQLEDELAGLIVGGGYAGPGASPDRADACVWAMTELMGSPGEPRLRRL